MAVTDQPRAASRQRRVVDSAQRQNRTIALGHLVDIADHPARLGQLMLLATGLITAVTAPALTLSDRGWIVLAVDSVSMLSVVAGSHLVRWERHSARLLMIFPAALTLALLALGLSESSVFAPLSGLFVFGFAFIGLTQPAGTSIKAAPVAAVVYLIVNGQLIAPVLIRLLVAVLVWTFLGELLAQLTSRRKQLITALEQTANRDPLTGTSTRRVWDDRLVTALPGSVAVMCDLDHFKQLNDTHGHAYGDKILIDFGALLQSHLRPVDCAARYGGEEFALLLSDIPMEDATAVLARLHAEWAELQPTVTFSAGLAKTRADRSNLDTLAAADAALYQAKAGGRNTDRIAPTGA